MLTGRFVLMKIFEPFRVAFEVWMKEEMKEFVHFKKHNF